MKRTDFITEVEPKHIKIFDDDDFHFRNLFNASKCRLRIFTFGRTKIAIALELPTGENPGASITNAAEELWHEVSNKFGDCEYFETYDNLTFDHVEIKYGKASWSRCVGDMEELLRSLK